jgi:BirA family biotin operon repressor/biotin-[acetyl-CoA-carboxylase] ligase
MALLTQWEARPVESWKDAWAIPHLEIHDSLGSTNDRGRELAREWAEAWTVVLAEVQTMGRGREGKGWVSPAGLGLWLSLLAPSRGAEADALLPLRVGLAVARALDGDSPPGGGVWLKWPNDLLLRGRKVGGILCEMAGPGAVVVGLGINVSQEEGDFPPEIRKAAVSLEVGFGLPVLRGELAGAIIREIRKGTEGSGTRLTPEELEAYSRRDALFGHRVESQLGGEGVALGLSPRGGLILEGPGGALREVRGGSVRRLPG